METNKGAFQLRSGGWVEAGGRLNLRFTRLQGKALDIATVICYPVNRPDLLPVFAFEWVVVGGRCHAMICDVEVCGPQNSLERKLQLTFRETARKFRTLFAPKEPPEWFQEIAQPHAQFFSAELEDLESVFELQSAYLRLTVDQFYRPVLSKIRGGEDHAEVLRYKRHHAENSPGTKMLIRYLGADAAEEFLFGYHFGPAQHADFSGSAL
jgi:hypothetical protein